jgi:hypothetical protein
VGGKSHQEEEDSLLPLPDIIQDSYFSPRSNLHKKGFQHFQYLGRHFDVTK